MPPTASSKVSGDYDLGGQCLAKTVFIIGGDTEDGNDPDKRAALRRFALAAGTAFAKSGVNLVLCSPMADAADYHVAYGYAMHAQRGVLSFHTPRFEKVQAAFEAFRKSYLHSGVKIEVYWHPVTGADPEDRRESWSLAQQMAVAEADAIVAIGGKPSATASTLIRMAEEKSIPVLPFAFLGGAAGQSHDRQFRSGTPDGIDRALLETSEAVDHIIPMLNHMMMFHRRGNLRKPGQKPTVFISRAQEHASWADLLAAYLTHRDCEAVLGDRVIMPDDMVNAAIRRAVMRSHIFIAISGTSYQESRWCQDEKRLASIRLEQESVEAWILDTDGSSDPREAAAGWRIHRSATWGEMRTAVEGLPGLEAAPASSFKNGPADDTTTTACPFQTPHPPEPTRKFRSLKTDEDLLRFLKGLEPEEARMIATRVTLPEGLLRDLVTYPQAPITYAADLILKTRKAGLLDELRAESEQFETDSETPLPPINREAAPAMAELQRMTSGRLDLDIDRYRDHIRRHCRFLQLEALTGEDPIYFDLELQQVFTPQDARDCKVYLAGGPQGISANVPPGEASSDTPASVDEDATALAALHEEKKISTPARPVLELLDDSATRCRVILGAAGSGKSTLGRIRLLEWDKKGATGPLPILVELRLFHRSGRQDFLDYLENDKDVMHRFSRAVLEARLEDGDAEFILDGLDEIFEPAERASVTRLIVRYAETYGNARMLVTSRLVGYTGRLLREAGFAHWLLADFDKKKIDAFLQHWTTCAVRDLGARQIVRRRMEDALRYPVVFELAGNPLLLTLMAVLARTTDLPRDARAIYENAGNLLLERWDAQRSLQAHTNLTSVIIDRDDKHRLLRELAWQMQTGRQKDHPLSGNLIAREDLQAVMHTAFRHRLPDDGLRRFAIRLLIDQLVQRNYILSYVGGEQFAFVHRGFMEYYASEYLLHRLKSHSTKAEAVAEIVDLYRKHAWTNPWNQVLLFAGARLEPAVADEALLPVIEKALPNGGGLLHARRKLIYMEFVCEILGYASDPREIKKTYAFTRRVIDSWLEVETLAIDDEEISTEAYIMPMWVRGFRDPCTKQYLFHLALGSSTDERGETAIALLVQYFHSADTRPLLERVVRASSDNPARLRALQFLLDRYLDESTRSLVRELALCEEDTKTRTKALTLHVEALTEAQARSVMEIVARQTKDAQARLWAVQTLVERFPDDATRLLLVGLAKRDEETRARFKALDMLAEHFNTAETRTLLQTTAMSSGDGIVHKVAIKALANHFGDTATRKLLESIAGRADRTKACLQAIACLAERFRDAPETEALMRKLGEIPRGRGVRRILREAKDFTHDRKVRGYISSFLAR